MWVFNSPQEYGVESDPTQGEFFINNEIDRSDALVRETIQNSLDARASGAPSVTVHFTLHRNGASLAEHRMAHYIGALKPHLQACGIDQRELNFFQPDFLVIEDFGTHGLYGDVASKDDNDFFFFWRVSGRSEKKGAKGGRWGLGKTVFPNASTLSAFFGLTIRDNAPGEYLLGQVCLKTHSIDGRRYMPYAFYTRSGEREMELPFEDRESLTAFRNDFKLTRTVEPGFSVVVPFPYPEITEKSLLEAAIVHYFYPIIAGDLIVRVNSTVLDSATISSVASSLNSQALSKVQSMIQFVREVLSVKDKSVSILDNPSKIDLRRRLIPKEAFAADKLQTAIEDLKNGRLVAVRVPVVISRKHQLQESSYVDLFLKRDANLTTGHDYYIRGGISVTGNRLFGSRPAYGLLLASHEAMTRFLGDAENPAHTQWNAKSTKLSAKYENAQHTVMFIRQSLVELLDTLSGVTEEEDKTALIDFFFADAEEGGTVKKGNTPQIPPVEHPEPKPQKLSVIPLSDGFKISAGKGLIAEDLPLDFGVTAAYEIRSGDAFHKYDPRDFDFSKAPIHVTQTGIDTTSFGGNQMQFTVNDLEFEIEFTGFDSHRDLRVKTFGGLA